VDWDTADTPARPDNGPGAAPAAGGGDLISPQAEAAAFWRMRGRLIRTLLRQTFESARLRLSMVLLLSLILWLVLYWLFHNGFLFFQLAIFSEELLDKAVRGVFGMFFLALTVMLVFSSGIILYSSLFRGRDIPLLLSLPARAERVFLHKFQEAILLSSWAFLLLASPMLLAYGVVAKVPWYYYAMLVPILIAFTYIPAVVGAICCLVLVRWFPRGRMLVLALAAGLIVLGGLLVGWSLASRATADFLTATWFGEVLGRLRITEIRWLPSWWLSTGLLAAARNQAAECVMFLALMISNALFFRLLGVAAAARLYRAAYSRLHTQRGVRKQVKPAWVDRALLEFLPLISPQMRLLIVKDLRLFRRDPAQWSQFLIFFGLLFLYYFFGIRRFAYDTYHAAWVHLISFLNVYVVGLLLSTFTTRFIFPMVSLEGRRFWILGLLPVRRETILWSKFVFAVGGSILPCSALILLSDLMLGVQRPILFSHQLTCVVLCFGLAGIAVGLGAKMPSLREESPSRIAAGFGGTLNLVLSTLYIVAVVLMTAVPAHFYYAARRSPTAETLATRLRLAPGLDFWMAAGTAGSVLLGILVTVWPLWIGFRAFRRLEF